VHSKVAVVVRCTVR